MICDPKPLSCGNCGGERYELYHDTRGIATVCLDCKCQSVITLRPAEVVVEWGEHETRGCLVYHPTPR